MLENNNITLSFDETHHLLNDQPYTKLVIKK